MKTKKYHNVGTFPKSNRKIVERSKINSPNTQIDDLSLSCLGTGWFKLALLTQKDK
jgi:hypothetical protein